MNLEFSHHAGVRMNQRGVPMDLLERVMTHADIEAAVGGGCTAFSVSRRRLKDRDVRRSFGVPSTKLRRSQSSAEATVRS